MVRAGLARRRSCARSTRSSTWLASRPGSRVLEIGTGWGTLAIEAARRGAHVTTLTLSAEQAALAQARVDAAGLTDLVDIRLAGLPRGRRHLRRDRQRRDDRGGRRGVLADVLLRARRAARTRRHGGHPGDPDEPRPLPRHPELLRLDPEAHLPRRADPFAARDRGHRAQAHESASRPRRALSGSTTRRRCGAGGTRSTRAGARSRATASTRSSDAGGSSTWPTARRASRRATWTSRRSASSVRCRSSPSRWTRPRDRAGRADPWTQLLARGSLERDRRRARDRAGRPGRARRDQRPEGRGPRSGVRRNDDGGPAGRHRPRRRTSRGRRR